MQKIDQILSKFPNTKKSGSGWIVNCPAHDDKSPSLQITEGQDGKVLFHCFAGCKLDDILAGAEIDKADIFPEGKQTPKRKGESFDGSPVVCRYPYRDEQGKTLFYVCRTEAKTFPQWNPVRGSWGLKGCRRVLYRLPELLKADPSQWVFLCEGEKDADRLASLGLVATTNPMGAGNWRDDYNGFLEGHRVVILPDNDEPGRKHAKTVSKALEGVSSQFKAIQLPNLPPKGDVSDWLNNGGSKERLLAMAEGKLRLNLVSLASVERQEIVWLWENRFPLGMFSLLVGDPGVGKSFLTDYMTAVITTGSDWPDVSGPSDGGSVVLLNDEDDFAHVIGPRLDWNKADCSKVYGLDGLQLPDGRTIEVFNISDPEHLRALEATVESLHDCRMIVFDPITAYLGQTNANSNAEVRSALTGLVRMANRQKVAVIGVSHLNKKSDLAAIHRVLGSMGFAAQARAVWAVVWDKDNEGVRLLQPVKSNLSIDPKGLAYTIEDGQVIFQDRTVTDTVNESMQAVPEKKIEAIEFLTERLANGATVASTAIHEEAEARGITEGTLRRAAKELNVNKEPLESGEKRHWFWSLNV